MELDDLFKRREARARYNQDQIRKVVLGKKTLCSDFDGFSSLFVPISRRGKVVGIFQCGLFLKKPPLKSEIIKRWKKGMGVEILRFDADFFQYVRTVLETPLVTAPVYRGLRELLETFAAVAAGEKPAEEACRMAERMKSEVFARHLPHRFWLEKAVKNNRNYPPHWWIDRAWADQWRREEQGIGRSPKVVVTVIPEDAPGESPDDLDLMLRNYQFQKKAFEVSRRLPHTGAVPLEDFGAVFFMSPETGAGGVQAKLGILDWIDRLSRVFQEEMGLKILVGISRCYGDEENLFRVYREAVLALEFCRPFSRPVLFYEDLHHNPTLSKPPLFYEISRRLVEVYLKAAVREIEPIRSRYIEEVVAHSAGRPETIRIHFLFVCGQLVDTIGRKLPGQEESLAAFLADLEGKLRETANLPELTAVFREALKRILEMNLRPGSASRLTQAEAACRYVEKNFSENLKAAAVARLFGFSGSAFTREFKKAAGMGFAAYLKKTRIQHAKHLLLSSSLSITRVSQEAGFNNLHYFFEAYKRETGQTPGETRTGLETGNRPI